MFNWTRFWCLASESFSLADDGFLFDPMSEYGQTLNPAARQFSEIANTTCLALLGEPGIGKSTAIDQHAAEIQEALGASGDILLKLNLGNYGDESRLIADLFESTDFRDWKEGHGKLHLFLDSLDECRLQIPHVAKLLCSGFERCHDQLDRMRLRISCRTADWPGYLTEQFGRLWGDGAPQIYELLPLRRRDVVLAANDMGVNADDFIQHIIRSGVQAFAIKPITTQFLLNVFKERGELPATQLKLYQEGCRLLCEEMNSARQSAGQIGSFSAADKTAVAERIAAAIVFCNKAGVRLTPGIASALSDDISVSELAETSSNSGAPIVDQLLRETLATGLFTGRGHQIMGFAHRTFAEYLAASYLYHSNLSTEERLKFVRHSDDPSNRIVPQLRETAAWLASMDPNVFRVVIDADPQVLIRSDVSNQVENDRSQLVARLLELAEANELDRSDWEEREHYHKLSHPSVAGQLTPLFVDRAKPLSVRRLAIELVEACCPNECHNELAEIALDESEDHEVRLSATHAVAAIGDEDTQLRLKPLALSVGTSQADRELKCAALRCLWPNRISAEELFGTLTMPADDRHGSYGFFISHELPKTLGDTDLPHALQWASRLGRNESREFSVRELVEVIAERGWNRLDVPSVFNSYVEYALNRLHSHSDILPRVGNDIVVSETDRRNLVKSVLPRITDFEHDGHELVFAQPRLVQASDVGWMLEQLHHETQSPTRLRWAKLIGYAFNSSLPGQIDAVITACDLSDELRIEFESRFAAVSLDSPEARRIKEQYYKYLDMQREDEEWANPPLLDPPPAVRIEDALQACENGKAEAWFDVSCYLQLEPNSTAYDRDLEIDLTKLPGWQVADDLSRRRIVNGAYQYLVKTTADGEKWLGTGSTPYRALCGYKALLLLAKEDPQLLDAISSETWAAWAAIIADFSDHAVPQENKELHDQIARSCNEKAPDAISACLRNIFERFDGSGRMFFLPQLIDRAWTESIENTLCEVAENPDVLAAVVERVLDALVSRSSQRGRDIAIALVSNNRTGNAEIEEKRVVAAVALLRHADDAGWPVVWPIIRQDERLGQTVLLRVASADMHNPSIAQKLSETDTAALFIWLESHFPIAGDREHRGGLVSDRDAIAEYRNGTLRALEHRGTTAAIDALSRIERELPHLDWMHRVVTSAKVKMLEKTWRPLTLPDLFAATQHENSRLVRGARDLQDVILESLESLQKLLQGETPAAPDVWDEVSPGKFRPKDENHLSDYIKRHLTQDLRGRGIVSLREVEIRRGEGGGRGEETDVHITGQVQGIVPGTLDVVSVIIEVKGSWNAQVNSAMETQLVNRYLKDNDCRHGIYLVGWYRCAQWDTSDRRLGTSANETPAQLFNRLNAQAESLSRNGLRIRAFVLNAALR